MQKKYTAMLRTSKLEYMAVCFELNVSARRVELAAVEKNLVSAKEPYWQDIVDNNFPDAIISGPKINVDYAMMDTRVLCNICVRGTDILSVGADILSNKRTKSMVTPYELSYFTGGLYCQAENGTSYGSLSIFVLVTQYLRTAYSLSSYGSLSVFVRLIHPIRSRFIPSFFRGFEQDIVKVGAVAVGLYGHVFSFFLLTF